MDILSNILKLLAGIGLFLFAMYMLEESLKNLSGRNFKLFLQRSTKNKVGAVAGGAIVTGVLQSSSMVSLMVLAFVGAGVFTMKNAMAIILGANLGTTIDSWVIATLGFKMNIEIIAYPMVFVGGFLLILFQKRNNIKYLSYFLFGFGLLFIGLTFMKEAMEEEVKTFDISKYTAMPIAVFLLIGFLITLLVQSSSVTMALTLSAIHAGAISFPIGAAIVLGSETGTTIKIVLSAIGGTASKKRVVLGNFLFNVCLTALAFILLTPIIHLITQTFNIKDPLIGLVTFSSLINLFSIFIFLPFLDAFAKFLELFFKDTRSSATAFIQHATIEEPNTALDLFKQETEYFLYNSMLYNLSLFKIESEILQNHSNFEKINETKRFSTNTSAEKHEFLRSLHGELQAFYIELRSKLENEQSSQLNQLISVVRSSMHAVKSVTDIESNINNLHRSSKDIKFEFFVLHKEETEQLYTKLNTLLTSKTTVVFEDLHGLLNVIQKNYSLALDNFYKDAQHSSIEDLDLTIAINFNRELFTSNKAILIAAKDFLLPENEAEEFNSIPVYST